MYVCDFIGKFGENPDIGKKKVKKKFCFFKHV